MNKQEAFKAIKDHFMECNKIAKGISGLDFMAFVLVTEDGKTDIDILTFLNTTPVHAAAMILSLAKKQPELYDLLQMADKHIVFDQEITDLLDIDEEEQ